MPQNFHIILLTFCVTIINSSQDLHRVSDILSELQNIFVGPQYDFPPNHHEKNLEKFRDVVPKANNLVQLKDPSQPKKNVQAQYTIDPILKFLKRRSGRNTKNAESSSDDDESSSIEHLNWKTEWREHWVKKKFDAINNSDVRGDVVNMVAARPWGVVCGDPNQHNMPWGTCMLPMECEPEYRIYRGDVFCGRSTFVCCALQLSTYDLYQGFDLSFEDSGLQTDSEERKRRGKDSNEKNKKKKNKARKKRKRERADRKRKIKTAITKITKEIRKILNRQTRNGTSQRKRKTKQLKKFIEEMKKKYKKDRQSVKDIHEAEIIKIDKALMVRLSQIMKMNQNFANNATFRDIVVNGTVSKKDARMLVEAFPELRTYLPIDTRRNDGGPVEKDYLDYDVEYGMVYY